MLKNIVSQKWRLTIRVIPLVAVVIVLKLTAHFMGWEFLSLSPLFTAIISANIFLIGFLITGVLSDYKESERLPSDLAASVEALSDEGSIILKNKNDPKAKEYLSDIRRLANSLLDWFHKKERTTSLMERITKLNDHFLAFESLTQANFIARLKQEQNNLRRIINRIHTIRETSFNAAGYAIAEVITFLLCVGLIFLKIDPYYESMFFVAFVAFILIYMVLLIKDLDNPFGYYEKDALSEEVSLKPLYDVRERLTGMTE